MPILHWLNDDQARKSSSQISYRLLDVDPKLSYGDSDTENMLIQGDNLEALKALLPYYAGQVKCIYIDPPYNTQSAFEHYDDNLEHSIWLSTMYPRLEMLRDLLADDGSIWVSIDDNEGHYLKVVMDEVLGRQNFVANVIWEKKYAPQNDAKWLSDSHDHIIVFAKSKMKWRPNLLPRTDAMNKYYKNPDNDPRGVWMSDNLSAKTYSANTDYPITTPKGKIVRPPKSRSWIFSKERYDELVLDNRIWFGVNGDKGPRLKKFLSEVQDGKVAKTIWLREEVGDNQDSKREVRVLNSESVFATPKPERLLQRVISLATNPGDLVLDSFLGSGTTAAVAHKMGRRYIGIEMGEHAVTHCIPRLQKVIDGEQGGISQEVNWQGGGGFRFYRLGETIFDEQGHINAQVRFAALAAHVWFSETHTPYLTPNPSPKRRGEQSPSLAGKGQGLGPLLGIHNETAYYLLYNGILGDQNPKGGNVLTPRVLRQLPKFKGKKIIYGEMSLLDASVMDKEQITFKHIPYDIKAR